MPSNEPTIGRRQLAVTYGAVVGIPLAILLGVLRFGHEFSVQHPAISGAAEPPAPAGGAPNFAMLMLQIGLIILLSRAVGAVIQRFGQPRVIGEMLAGILLGPSFMGWVAPGFSAWLFPPNGFGVLNAISQLGLVLFMFMVGLELDIHEVHRHRHVAVLVSHGSITAPMMLGTVLAIFLYPAMAGPAVGFTAFALFTGVAMSITAFPVLARILSERNLLGTQLGALAIACAAVDDVTGWCILAYVVGFVRASHSSMPVWLPMAGLPVFLAIMFWGARRLLRGMERDFVAEGALSNDRKALVLVLLLTSALVTEALGLHLLFGAFILGAVMPKHPGFVRYVIQQFESLTVVLMLPLFFAYTGLRTRIGEIRGAASWGICLLIIAVAVTGKLGGTGLAARLGGVGWRQSLVIGSLMNTRGLMELVVLNIGLDSGVISTSLFSMMVVMAIVTTMMTPPLLEWLYPRAVGASTPG